MVMRHVLRLVLAAALLGGCASLTEPMPLAVDAPQTYGTDGPDSRATPLWAALVSMADARATHAGVTTLETGAVAYRARLALIEAATVAIDVQSYIWEFDQSGQAITDALLRAAERGVRVRLLIDGFRVDDGTQQLKQIARHPNFHVRLYNAFRTSFRSDFVRYSELVSDFKRLNQRMHDKVLAVDGAAAILGGRNVSDEYFGLSAARYFHDRDVLLAGPLTAQVSDTFDLFWNSDYAVPVSHFEDGLPKTNVAPPAAVEPQAPGAILLPLQLSEAELDAELGLLRHALVWADMQLVRSAPGLVFAEQAPPDDETFEVVFLRAIEDARDEIVLQTPYLTLTPVQRATLIAARQRGVAIKLNTNSLASTDWPIVQHGYMQERRQFLHWGVYVFELKDQPATCCRGDAFGIVPATAILHQKTIVIDGRLVFVGSFNIDYRSIRHNSEVGVIVDSLAFGARVLAEIAEATQPDNSWRLTIGPSNEIVWLDESVDPPTRYLDDPHTSLLDQLAPWFGYFLPIDGLL